MSASSMTPMATGSLPITNGPGTRTGRRPSTFRSWPGTPTAGPAPCWTPAHTRLVSFLSTHEVLTHSQGRSCKPGRTKTADNQTWTLSDQGDGYYSLLENGSSSRALTVSDDPAKPGSKVGVAPFAKRDTQLWFLQQNDDGTYTILAKSGGKTLALDIGNCSLTDGAGVGLWTSLGNNCQKWSFHRQ